MKEDKMILLGHSDGGVAVVMDLASELLGINQYDIVKNVDRPDCVISSRYSASHFFEKEYMFSQNLILPVQFGVHHSNVKYLLYHFFRKTHGIGYTRYVDIIHSSTTYFGPSSAHAGGILIEPMALVSSMCQIGFGVTIKRSASVGHHAVLGDFVNINPGAVLSGFVNIGMGTEIGTGVTISNNVTIGKRCLIGAGSVVTRDIPDGVIAYGNPCKVIRENERWNGVILEPDFSIG